MKNNLARVVCKSPYNTNVTELLRELQWLPNIRHRITCIFDTITIARETASSLVHSLILYKTCIILYKSCITIRWSSSDLLIVPHRVTIVKASRAFHVAAPTIWNNLPDFVNVADSLNVFKRHLKCHLFDAAFKIN